MFSASIVVYNSPLPQLKRAVECILRAHPDKVWIVFNGSDDDYFRKMKEEIGTLHASIAVERMGNRGFGAGHNLAIRKALEQGSDYHLVANADLWWEGDVITPMLRRLESDPQTGLIAPRTLYPDGSLQYTCRMLPSPAQLLLRRFLPRFFKRQDDRYLLKDLNHSAPINAPYLLGCFMLFRSDALRKEGIFDERFFMYPEDIDITRRLHRRWFTLYWPEVTIIHEHARESRKNMRMLRIHAQNMARYFNKYGWLRDPERKAFNKALRHSVNVSQTKD